MQRLSELLWKAEGAHNYDRASLLLSTRADRARRLSCDPCRPSCLASSSAPQSARPHALRRSVWRCAEPHGGHSGGTVRVGAGDGPVQLQQFQQLRRCVSAAAAAVAVRPPASASRGPAYGRPPAADHRPHQRLDGGLSGRPSELVWTRPSSTEVLLTGMQALTAFVDHIERCLHVCRCCER